MICILDHCITTPVRGSLLKPYGDWDGISTDYKFEVTVKTDSDYEKFPGTKISMTGCEMLLNGVTFRS